MKTFSLILWVLLFSSAIHAGNTMPSTFTYQGRFMNASGTAPLSGSLTVYMEIYNPSTNCLLYSERQNISTSDGLFSIRIGAGTRNVGQPGYNDDPNYQFAQIFTNKDAFPTVAGSCAGGYTPGATDGRILKVHVYDGTTTTTLADQNLTPVPQANVADTISGVPLQGLTLNWTTATRPVTPVTNVTHGYNRTLGRFEIWNGTIWAPTTPKFSASAINDSATDNHVLKWNATTDMWEPSDVGTLLGDPGGDVDGTYTNMDVIAIRGQPVAATAPNLGEVLKWNGTAWEAALDAGGIVMAGGAGTTNRFTKWNASDELADSSVSDDGTNVTFSIPLVMSAQQIKDVAPPTDPDDAVTLNYLFQHVNPGTADGQILVWDNTAQEWQPAAPSAGGGTTISGGTQHVLPKFNATGDNIVDSSISDNGSHVTMQNPPILKDAMLFMTQDGLDFLFMHTTDTNTAATTNTFTGFQSGNAGVSGGNNTAYGYSSLNGITTGLGNTAIGSYAGLNATTTSSGNIFIGDGSGPTAGAAINNRLYIDNSANNTPLIYGDFANDYVRIHNVFQLPEIAAPGTPDSGYGSFYIKSDGKPYFKNDAGTEYDLAASGGGGALSGTQNYLSKFNAVGDNVENSAVIDTGATGVNFVNRRIQFNGDLFLHNVGSENTFLGVDAGNTTMSGAGHTAIGYSAGGVTDGAYNTTAVGNQALRDNVSGANNTAVGAMALNAATGGSNTAVGKSSLNGIVAGGANTALGESAGANATAASSNNVFLGHFAGPTAGGAISDRLYIDNSANNTPLIYGDFSSDFVRIHNIFELPEIAAPATPGSGYGRFYVKSDGKPYFKNDGGTEYDLAASGGGGSTISGGTQNYIPKFNATGDNIVNSGIIDNGTNGVDFTEGIIQMLGNVVFHPGMGANSTYVGLSAGHAGNSTGGGNTAVGSGAMTPMTSGTNNTAVGYNALNSLATGTNNTAFGKDAGAAINGASTGNVFLGHGAGPTAAGAISNKLYIHNSQSNTPLIYGDFSAATLAVNGDLTSTTYYYSSDRRLKENITTIESPLEKILKLRAVEFDWIKSGKHDLGFIAQEVEEIYPDLVTTNDQGTKAVKYGNIVSPLVGAVQELNAKCEMSKSQIADIDNRLKNIERKVASIEQRDLNQDLMIEQLRRENEELKKQIGELKRLIKK